MKLDKKKILKSTFEWTSTIVIAIVLALLIRMFIFEIVEVKQSSMYPTLKENEKLLITKPNYWFAEPEYGDIVILNVEENINYVKRVIATEGQTIEIKDSVVYIDDEPLDEPYLVDDLEYSDFEKITVEENTSFVMGDNRPASLDSRESTIGCVDNDDIFAKAIIRFVPFTILK